MHHHYPVYFLSIYCSTTILVGNLFLFSVAAPIWVIIILPALVIPIIIFCLFSTIFHPQSVCHLCKNFNKNNNYITELEKAMVALRHDLRGILSPALLSADQLEEHNDQSVVQSAKIIIHALEKATARLSRQTGDTAHTHSSNITR